MKFKIFPFIFILIITSVLSVYGYKFLIYHSDAKNKEVLSETTEELFPDYESESQSESVRIIGTNTPTPRSEPKASNAPRTTSTPTITSVPALDIQASGGISPNQDIDAGKVQSIYSIFESIAKLNTDLAGVENLNALLKEQLNNYLLECQQDRDNSNIFDPFAREALYQQCVNGAYEIFILQDTSSIRSQITNLSNQAYNTALTCTVSDCLSTYWTFVNTYESNGFIAR